MKIAFDISQTGDFKAGCGYFADNLIDALLELRAPYTFDLYPTFGDFFWDSSWRSSIKRRRDPRVRNVSGQVSQRLAQSFWNAPAPKLVQRLAYPDILHANNYYCPAVLPTVRLVYTLYDLSFLSHPDWTTEQMRLGCFDGLFKASCYADAIIAISEESRHEFLRYFSYFPTDRIRVVYPASRYSEGCTSSCPPSDVRIVPGKYWLTVGTLEPRKNHARLIAAYAKYRGANGSNMPLVIVGGRGWMSADPVNLAQDLGVHDHVIQLGYVDDSTLAWLYEHCFAFVYPTLFEGFGMPVLEAMSLGAPVISSTIPSIREIVGSSGLLVEPTDTDGLARAMHDIEYVPDLRDRVAEAGSHRARDFSWQRAAREVIQTYETVLAMPKRSENGD
jgi:glycosyltransferase involved in cell wall biosynthesis